MSATVSTVSADLHKAIDAGDEEKITKITASYGSEQRDKIIPAYHANYGIPPSEAIRRAFKSGFYETMIVHAWTLRFELRAKLIRESIKGKIDVVTLLDLVIACMPDDWYGTKVCYTKLYGRELVREIEEVVGVGTPWQSLVSGWVKHDRKYRKSIKSDAEAFKMALDSDNYEVLGSMLATSVPDEWMRIAAAYEEATGMPVDQAIASRYVKVDQTALILAHHWLCEPGQAAAYICSQCCAERKGDYARICRFTSMMYDHCLKCKYAYRTYGSLAMDIRKCFEPRLAKHLLIFWRVE